MEWEQNKEVSEKHLLGGEDGLHMNLLKLEPGRHIPLHKHVDTRYNYVLKGSMSDEHGEYTEGDLVVNEKGSEHSINAGEKGCEFLVIWGDVNGQVLSQLANLT